MENNIKINKNSIVKIILAVCYGVICALFITLAFVTDFLFENWSGLLPDEIIYHIFSPLKGTDKGLIIKGLLSHGSMIVVTIAVLLFVNIYIYRIKKGFKETVALTLLLSFLLCFSAGYQANLESGIISYGMDLLALKNGEEDYIREHYVNPNLLDITAPEKKKNLIYIYLESFEVSFSDEENGGFFKENVIPEMTDIVKENECFNGNENKVNGAYSLPGTNWTAAGMFSEASGLPIKVSLLDNAYMGREAFLPKVTTLGDILLDSGYRNVIRMGSDISFGGRDFLFEEHGNYEFRDYNYAIRNGEIPADYRVFWGYEDKKLFKFAKNDLSEISKGDEPFCYTLLTVDTHFVDGYLCPDCPENFKDQYSNVYNCSSIKINEFLSWLKTTDFYEDTVVVLSGDHLTMDDKYNEKIDESYPRKVVFTVINSDRTPVLDTYREYSVFDIFPTTLYSLGYEIPGNKLGLGVNLFSEEKTLTETIGYEALSENMEKPSNFYNQFDSNGILDEIDSIRERVNVDPKKDGAGYLIVDLIDVAYFECSLVDNAYMIVYIGDEPGKRYDLSVVKHWKNKQQVGLFRGFTDVPVTGALSLRVEGYISYDGEDKILFVDKTAELVNSDE